jgi:flagellar basal-body rod protein FlgG
MQDRILRIGESGLEAADLKVRSLMQNLANNKTPGYQESDVAVRAFPLYLDSVLGGSFDPRSLPGVEPQAAEIFHHQRPGALLNTNNPTDLAIRGDGFFAVSAPWGEGYTRDGRFTVDKFGRIISTAGNFPLLGVNGPLSITPGELFTISPQGEVVVRGEVVDKLRVVSFEDPSKLESVNGIIFKAPEGQILASKNNFTPQVLQGFVETSNVDQIRQMVDLILLGRIYGVNSKLIQTRDALMTRAIELAKPME